MKRALLFLAALALMCGCGPEETSLDRYNQQLDSIVDQQKALYAPLAGSYVGYLTRSTGDKVLVALYLAPVSVVQTDTGQDQPAEIPTLSGTLNICTKTGACFNAGDDNTYVYPVTQFTGCKYSPQTQHIYLYSSGTAGASGTSGIGGAAVAYVDGTLDGDHLTGRFYTSVDLNVGTIDLTKQH